MDFDSVALDICGMAGPLEVRLNAAMGRGFRQVVLSAADLASHPQGVDVAIRMVRESGAGVLALRQLDDFEGHAGALHEYKVHVAKALLGLCHAVGAQMLVVKASSAPDAGLERERIVRDLAKLSALAVPKGIRMAYRATPGSAVAADLVGAEGIVNAVERSNFGLALDTSDLFTSDGGLDALDRCYLDQFFLVELCDLIRLDNAEQQVAVDRARIALDAARASLATRNGALVLRAPASGTVEVIGASAGELVAAGATIVSLVKEGDLRARFGVDPAIARRIPRGSYVEVSAAGGKAPFNAPVLSVDGVVDPVTKLASVYVRIPDEQGVGAGESLTGRVLLANIAGGITIPYAALLDDGGQPFVFVIANGVAKRRDIVIGPRTGDRIGVTSGLKAGERVATVGVTALEDGMKVRIQGAKT